MRGLIWAFLSPLVAIVHAQVPMAGADEVAKRTESMELGNGIRSLKWDDARGGLAIELWTVQENLHSVELSFGDDNMKPVCSCPVVVLCAPARAALKLAAESTDESAGESPSSAARPALTVSPSSSTQHSAELKTPSSTPALLSPSSSSSSSSSTITHLATNTTTQLTDRRRWPSCGVPGQKTHDMGSGKAMADSKTWTPLSVSHGELGEPSPLVVEVLLPRENLETCGVTNQARGMRHQQQQQQQQQHRQQETKKENAMANVQNDLSNDKTYAKTNNPCLFTGMLCMRFRYAPVVDGGYCTTTMQSCHMITVHVPPPIVRGPMGGATGSGSSSVNVKGNNTTTAAANNRTTTVASRTGSTTTSIAHRVLLRGSRG